MRTVQVTRCVVTIGVVMPVRVLEANGIRVRIAPVDGAEGALAADPSAVLEASAVRAALGGARHRLVHLDIDDADGEQPAVFDAVVYDYDNGRSLVASGLVDDPRSAEVASTAEHPRPDADEFAEAVAALAAHDEVGDAVTSGALLPYAGMPPLLDVTRADGAVERRVTVGLRTRDTDAVTHRFAAVNLVTGAVELDPAGAPESSDADCGAPESDACPIGRRSGAVRVRVTRGDERLWDLVVRRPRISSGTFGSGVELRGVRYGGMRLLRTAHAPILNVEYDRSVPLGGCGPTYRDWLDEEACFVAHGQDVLPGYRACPTRPSTIFESGVDGGNFRGVAFDIRGTRLVIQSEVRAGWYRYVSEWRLSANGAIRPRFGFEAVHNPCTCKPHRHHVYWRWVFDIDGKPATVQEFNRPRLDGHPRQWHTIRRETRRRRNASRERRWRIRNRDGVGLRLVPGDDGRADDFGIGDLWVLRRRPGEVDDGYGVTDRAKISQFITGDDVTEADLVLWYAGHFTHAPGEDVDHHVGPHLRPIRF